MHRSVSHLGIAQLGPAQLRHDLGIRDLSDPAQGPHAIQILIDRAVGSLSRAWDCEVRWCRGQRIVPVADNYDRLGYPAGAISRAARYTRYVDGERLLRSHSTAMVPPALRELAAAAADDVLLVCPGIVYRRDAIDWQHTGTPHQLDLWRITRRPMREADMDEMIAALTGALAAGLPVMQQPRTHPYTVTGRQVDVRYDGRWVEVAECGLAHPRVLAAAGLGGRGGDSPARRPARPAEPARPRAAQGPGRDADEPGGQRAARPYLPGAAPGHAVPVVRMKHRR